MSRSFVLHPRATLAAVLLLRDHLTGFSTTAETRERVDALLLPALGLEERIAELERKVEES